MVSVNTSYLAGFLFLSLFFGLFVTRTGRTGGPILTICNLSHMTPFRTRICLLGGFVNMPSQLGGQIPQDPNYGSVSSRFPAKLVKSTRTHQEMR